MAPPVMIMTKDQSKVEVDDYVHQICGTGRIPSIKMKLFLLKQSIKRKINVLLVV